MSVDHQYNEKRKCLECGKEYRRDQLVSGVCNKCIGKILSNGEKCHKCGIDGVKLYNAYGKKTCLNCFKKLKLYDVLQYVESQFRPVSKEECAKEFGIIPNTAEKYMSRLFHNGQLSRERKGSQYVYTSINFRQKKADIDRLVDQIEKLQRENRVLRDFVGMKYKEELCQLAIDAGRDDLVEWLDGLFGGDGKQGSRFQLMDNLVRK